MIYLYRLKDNLYKNINSDSRLVYGRLGRLSRIELSSQIKWSHTLMIWSNWRKEDTRHAKWAESMEGAGIIMSLVEVLRRNTLMSTILSMPSADEKETAATATAKHMSEQ